MSVVLINGSPKGERSNSLKLARAFLEGIGQSAEVVEVARLKIMPCLGCFACWNETPGECALNDDMAGILEKIIAAETIVWSFPLYYCSVPGPLKNLIDRQLPLLLPFMAPGRESGYHPPRHDLSGQRRVVVSTCGFWTSQGNYDGVTATFDLVIGCDYEKIFCGQGELFRAPELRERTDAYLATVRRAGAEYAQGGIAPATRAELAEPIFPREAFERLANASWGLSPDGHSVNPERVDDGLELAKRLAAIYRPDGRERVVEFVYLDLRRTCQIVCRADGARAIDDDLKPYDTRIETPYSLWRDVARGEISGAEALFQKKFRVLGDFSLMTRWDELFGGPLPSRARGKAAQSPKANMAALLGPWLALWVGTIVNPTVGGNLGIMAAALIPLTWLALKPTLYERLTVFAVACLSLAALAGAGARLIVPIGYALMGLMWLATLFGRIPLTARYSADRYGGEKAFKNPLFIRTNWILTAFWGVAFLLMALGNYALIGGALDWLYLAIVNAAIPGVMGGFSAWFQRQYPAKWARG
ncbi:MAG: flavodoxin family protein [Deltaproteobacteria bacterium]|jgi:multimeric flavodoxin WrbA|nr:flavodoxin family protein [Deltaproteobacteria bacterium]